MSTATLRSSSSGEKARSASETTSYPDSTPSSALRSLRWWEKLRFLLFSCSNCNIESRTVT